MSREIWKFPLDLNNPCALVPEGASILSIQVQGGVFGTVCLWAEVDTQAPSTLMIEFRVFGTGHTMPDPSEWTGQFISTVQLPSGLVFHVYRTL
jgi:hypothetical protein